MYAILLINGKQHVVSEGETITVGRLSETKKAAGVTLDKVLLYSKGHETKVGNPFLKDVKVSAEIIGHGSGPKVVAFKYRRRKGKRRKIGFRQQITRLKIKQITA